MPQNSGHMILVRCPNFHRRPQKLISSCFFFFFNMASTPLWSRCTFEDDVFDPIILKTGDSNAILFYERALAPRSERPDRTDNTTVICPTFGTEIHGAHSSTCCKEIVWHQVQTTSSLVLRFTRQPLTHARQLPVLLPLSPPS